MDKIIIMMGLVMALSSCSDVSRETYVVIIDKGTEIKTDHKTIDGLMNGRIGYYLVSVNGEIVEVPKHNVIERIEY